MNDITEKYGIVVLLDALGIQNSTIAESENLIKFFRICSDESDSMISSYLSMTTNDKKIEEYVAKYPPSTRTFGDTFLLTWELEPGFQIKSKLPPLLESVEATIALLIMSGIRKGILLRGAFSIGKYLESETTILGPAIADAAAWYESANWFGCMSTPRCTSAIKSLGVELSGSFIKYQVPMKGNEEIEAYCMNWPYFLDGFDDEGLGGLIYFHECISKLPIPKGTEVKYSNSETFVKYCIAKEPVMKDDSND